MTGHLPSSPGRFSIATLGCKVNQFETAAMIEQLQAAGWQQVPFGEPAELCLINSCTVTAKSDAETRRLIRRARRSNPLARIVATGCSAQVAPHNLIKLAEVDQILGNQEKLRLCHHLQQGRHQVSNLNDLPTGSPLRLTSFADHIRAFLQVQNGCNTGCSYCIVPTARGPSRSVAFDEVLLAARELAGRGFQELVLTGIHLGAYGLDLSPPCSLLELVQRLTSEMIVPRLRLGSIEPNELTDDLLALFCNASSICPHLHIPLQSGSDSVLVRMGRPYSTDFFRGRIEQAARLLPDAFIAADLIAGFPGETEAEHAETCRFVASLPLADLHVFPYSSRPGTRAAAMPGHLQPRLIKERAEQLRAIAADKRQAFSRRFIGKTLQVLGQRHHRATGQMNGIARNYLEVAYPASPDLRNQEVVVQILQMVQGQLQGTCIEACHPTYRKEPDHDHIP